MSMAARQPIVLPPLHRAAKEGDAKKLKKLLAEGQDVNAFAAFDSAGATCTALFIAVINRQKLICRLLLDASANPCTVVEPHGKSVLYVAVTMGELSIVEMLLQAGAFVNDAPGSPYIPLSVAALMNDARMLELLLSLCAMVDVADQSGLSPLMLSAQNGSEDCVNSLLHAGADITKTTDIGFTALHFAVRDDRDKVEPLKYILISGTGFERPSAHERPKVIKLLLQSGLDVNVATHEGLIPLMLANELAVVKVLLENGASLTAIDFDGNNAIHEAAVMGCSSAVICLLYREGADPTLRNKFGETPADVARSEGHPAAAQLLDMLAIKYREKEAFIASQMQSEELAEVEEKIKALTACSSGNDEEAKVSTETQPDHSAKEEKQPKVLRPCLHCQSLTHRRCARCKTTFFCSRDCQMATMAEHKPICLQIHEERASTKAERRTKEEEA